MKNIFKLHKAVFVALLLAQTPVAWGMENAGAGAGEGEEQQDSLKSFFYEFEDGDNIREKVVVPLEDPISNGLEKLLLDFSGAGKNVDDDQVCSIVLMLSNQKLKNLQELYLDFSGCNISDRGVSLICQSLEGLCELKKLALDFRNMSVGQAVAVAEHRPDQSRFIKMLHEKAYSDNKNDITDVGGLAIAKALLCLPELTSVSIDLNFTEVGPEGARAIIQVLSDLPNRKKVELDLYDIDIANSGLTNEFYHLQTDTFRIIF